jgi:hypothetical protein
MVGVFQPLKRCGGEGMKEGDVLLDRDIYMLESAIFYYVHLHL